MHIIVGLILILVAFGAVFIIFQTGAFQPVTGAFQGAFGEGLYSSSTITNHSAVYQQVKIQSVSAGSGLDKTMRVSLMGAPTGDGLTITGWTLKTNLGSYKIPKAANIYSPSVAGTPPEDIYIRKNGIVNVYSGKNPQKDQPQAIRAALGEWRVWLGATFLQLPHGTVTLLDDKGKVVDEYNY